ncbi:alanine racemase [Actinosynnema sp. NPDC050436]|uniref:diaminopimelate decarboxylase family protein n=1 Tax=Actinosynnema sp. NPDC050436 TaxID=3155659 RepID=UPI0033C03EFC
MAEHPPAVVAARRDLLRQVAAEFGSAYVYDLDLVRSNAAAVRAALAPVQLCYVVKANPLHEVVLALDDVLDGVAVTSPGELRHVRELGVAPERVTFGGPVPTPADVARAVRWGVRAVHLASAADLAPARAARDAAGTGTALALRVDPAGGALPADPVRGAVPGDPVRGAVPPDPVGRAVPADPAGAPSRFGVAEEALPGLAERGLLDAVQGVHVHAGSRLRDWAVVARRSAHLARIAGSLAARLGRPLDHVGLGGGFGVRHPTDGRVLELDRLSPALRGLPTAFPLSPGGKAVLELGRYLVAPGGVLVTAVVGERWSRGTRFVFTDCGHHGFPVPSPTGGPHRVVPLDDRPFDRTAPPVVVCGPLSAPADEFGVVRGWAPRPGDAVAVCDAGAYGYSMSPQFFLSRRTPAEVVVEHGRARLVRERIDPGDYLSWGRPT